MLAGDMLDHEEEGVRSRLLGFVRERRTRRNLMFIICLSASVLVVAGSVPLEEWLEHRVNIFLVYWGFTSLSVILLMLLALYDILRIWSGEDR